MSVPSQMPCLAILPHQAELVVLRGHDFCAGSLLEKKDSVRVFFLAFLDFCVEENGLQKQACWHICSCTHRHRPEGRQLNQRNCIAASQHGQFQCHWGINPGTKQLIASFYQSTSRLVLEKHRPTKTRHFQLPWRPCACR